MFFDSSTYLVFLAITVLVYWRLRHQSQNIFLLVASYFFYGWWDWRFLGLMALSTVLDYLVAKKIDASDNPRHRKLLLTFSLIFNFSVLGFFKYFNFFVDSFAKVAEAFGLQGVPHTFWTIILPPAISFYTFQEVAYIVDVYKKKLPACKSLTDYALFVSLFPHLIAGPIQQPSHLLPQVQKPRQWNSSTAFDGLLLIAEGLFRKIVIADNCALIANAAFAGNFGPPSLAVTMIGTYAFAFQIYGDFSGYSSIARGSAQLMGFHFMVNFRQPYLAQSLQDFWRRWHISLSSWLRDYLYIALGGNRKGTVRTYLNLLWTMLLGGLWHGANWTFVIWGFIHGAGLAVERFIVGGRNISDSRSFIGRWVRRVVIFHIVCVAWIFFRATSLSEAFEQLGGLTTWTWGPYLTYAAQFLVVYVGAMLVLDYCLERSKGEYLGATRSPFARMVVALGFAVLIALFGATQSNAFIYFQF
ncbi:MAG TPA: MBOAT family protein [Steroidobacteraceae bacterium]|nr:MBOAT family protein [Steroidobacteraceae bacterium]